jgi:hypothetical protein
MAYTIDADTIPTQRDGPCHSKSDLTDDWTLSRAQFYVDSGVRSADMDKSMRFAAVHRFWSGGGYAEDDGGDIDQEAVIAALRTSDVAEVMAYLARYALIRDRWWELALRRRESRADFKRYSGKRKVLDGFFSRIKKALAKRFPGVNIQVAYGSAYQTMKPTGKGEVAVPVHSTFKSCCRVFGPDNVVPTDEYGSTSFEWDTGARKLAVYRKVTGSKNPDGKGSIDASKLGSTTSKYMPRVTNDADAVEEYILRHKNKIRTARNGLYDPLQADPTRQAVTRYPEVRGLRFSTKTRSYLDRDLHAARTIGRLRTVEMMGRARPTPFCRGLG